MRKASAIILAIAIISISIPARARTPEVASGLNYLHPSRNPDGSWGVIISGIKYGAFNLPGRLQGALI